MILATTAVAFHCIVRNMRKGIPDRILLNPALADLDKTQPSRYFITKKDDPPTQPHTMHW